MLISSNLKVFEFVEAVHHLLVAAVLRSVLNDIFKEGRQKLDGARVR